MLRTLARRLFAPRTRLRLVLAAFRLRGLAYRGNAVECPLCGGHFRRFLAFGTGPDRRDGAECPACHALERTRLLGLFLEREEGLFRRSPGGPAVRVLHFAPEPSLQRSLRRAPGVAYRSADLTWPLADDHVDLHALPYPDASYEFALCSHVLAHVADDRQALAELARVLRPGGLLLLQSKRFDGPTREVPPHADALQRATALGQADRFRNYGDDHDARVTAAGFSVEVVDYAAAFTPPEQQRYGIAGAGDIYRCVRCV